MQTKAKIPFKQILTVVKTLTAAQKTGLKKELAVTKDSTQTHSAFTQLLLDGPVFTKKQIKTIEDNRKSIAQWRTKS